MPPLLCAFALSFAGCGAYAAAIRKCPSGYCQAQSPVLLQVKGELKGAKSKVPTDVEEGVMQQLMNGLDEDAGGVAEEEEKEKQHLEELGQSRSTLVAKGSETSADVSGEGKPRPPPMPPADSTLKGEPLCSARVVTKSCGEIGEDYSRTDFAYPEELQDELGTDWESINNFLTEAGIPTAPKKGLDCMKLCEHVRDMIPEAQRPPASDIVSRNTEHGLKWDLDAGPQALDAVHIPNNAPDFESHPLPDFKTINSLLQASTNGSDAALPYIAQANKPREPPEQFTPESMSVAEVEEKLANLFRMYPAPRPPSNRQINKATFLAIGEEPALDQQGAKEDPVPFPDEQYSGECGREAIWGNGVEYVGCQTRSRSGKPCVHWAQGPTFWGEPDLHWKEANKNWCRNPNRAGYTIWCLTGPTIEEWESCDPLATPGTDGVSAPPGFAELANAAAEYASAWISKAISKWDAHHLPPGYETWLGPSEADPIYGRTIDGCECVKEWNFMGQSITNYCGNPDGAAGDWCLLKDPNCKSSMLQAQTHKGCMCKDVCANHDNDPNGAWCFVEDTHCQGENYGYCDVNQIDDRSEVNWGYCAIPRTVQGCACRREWSYAGEQVEGCANPGNDPGGNWCLVEDPSCLESSNGADWGYCKQPCGDSCKNVRETLEKTREVLDVIGFEYANKPGVYAYVSKVFNSWTGAFPVASHEGIESRYLHESNGKFFVLKKRTTSSDHIGNRAIMTFAPAWWNACNGDIKACQESNPTGFGTLIGTVVHETMHHFPIGADDYLYYREKVKAWVKANRLNANAMRVVKDCADCIEYFVDDLNGYTETGR